jgi:hypothetical protein
VKISFAFWIFALLCLCEKPLGGDVLTAEGLEYFVAIFMKLCYTDFRLSTFSLEVNRYEKGKSVPKSSKKNTSFRASTI